MSRALRADPEPKLRLYGSFQLCPNTWRVQGYLDYHKVPYEKVEVDILDGGNRQPEFLAINPQGFVPALVDDSNNGLKVIESGAVLQYVDTVWGDLAGTPSSAEELSRFYELWYRVVGSLRNFESRYVVHGGDYNPAAPKSVLAEYQYLEQQIGDRAYLASKDQPSILDFLVLPNVHVSHISGLDLASQGLPKLEAWRQRMLALPGVAEGDVLFGWKAAVLSKQGLEWEQRRNAWFEYQQPQPKQE